ncbi:MAG: MGH1-like glycoside hydrolase domain-containing protein, partial [Dermatophilaceae bacterium]
AAAGHHIYEGRWLRDSRYLDDYVDYWLTGAGSGPKPANDFLGKDTTDWAHQYSFWAADAVLARAEVDGRFERAVALLPELEEQWRGWDPQFDPSTGLYWQTPVWDAMEYTASSYQSDDPYHGGTGYRPTLNAYQYGDARAIADLARLAGDPATAQRYDASASALRDAQERLLWDPDTRFYKHVMRDDNPGRARIADRELIGYLPWAFGMAPEQNVAAWEQLLDPQGFRAPYGPTTVERRSLFFMKDAEAGCCRWSGPSWPYATSQTLTALGTLLTEYPEQDTIGPADFTELLRAYALTQRRNGQPYVAEAHHPDEDRWLYDAAGHSEDYNHSTYTDLVLSTLIGIRGQQGDTVRVDPQVAPGWSHFAAENVPYHGANLSVVWDADGSHYGVGVGLSLWRDGVRIHSQPDLGPVTVSFPRGSATALAEEVDDAANPGGREFPAASASYSNAPDPPARAIDGQEFQLDVPSTRWTTYLGPNAVDWLQVDLGASRPVDDVRTVFYDDGRGVRLPASYDVQYRTPDGGWAPLPGQTRTPASPVAGAPHRITLETPVQTDALRLVVTHTPGSSSGVTSFGTWRARDR